jgi:hypothetical protein
VETMQLPDDIANETILLLTKERIQPHQLLNGKFSETELRSIGIGLGVAKLLVELGKSTTLEEKQIEMQEKKEKKKKIDVFLSFTGEEEKWGKGCFRKAILGPLALSLENEGLSVFYCETSINEIGNEKYGEEAKFGEIIRDGIWNCRGGGLFVMLMTDNYLDTEWPLMEMGMAYLWREKGIRLLPILLTKKMTMDICKVHRHMQTLTPELTDFQFEEKIKLADDDAGERPQEQRSSEDEKIMRTKRIEEVVEKLKRRILEGAKTQIKWNGSDEKKMNGKDDLNVRDMESAVQVHTFVFDFILILFLILLIDF